MSCQCIYDILSEIDVAERAVHRIPSAPKTNCYFILNIGKDLMDYDSSAVNKLNIQDRLRDGTSAWDDISVSNFAFY